MGKPLGEQVVVITGASQGIGRETALQMARRGASLVLAARNTEALDELAVQVDRLGGQAEVVATDVAEYDQVERLAARAVERFGRIDTWVNNAAVSIYATVEQLEPDEMDRLMRVNLLGPMYGSKAAIARMKRAARGRSSTSARPCQSGPSRCNRPTWPASTGFAASPRRCGWS